MTKQVAFLFPGQGSQAVGMGADVYEQSPAARRVFHTFDEALGFSLSELCFQGPEETLRATINAQPAIVAVSLAYLAAFQEALGAQDAPWTSPLTPTFTAGHSVGECTALVIAGAVDLAGVAYLVRERGRLMHQEELLCPGGMAAIIGLEAEEIQAVCEQATREAQETLHVANAHPGLGQVVVANYNAPGQIVISGEQHALEIATALATKRGAKKVIPLSVSGAFHSPVMLPAAEHMAQSIASMPLHDATLPLISNISATPLQEASTIRAEMAQQVAASVQWIRTIEYLVDAGVTTFFEIGPGKALAGMIKRIAKGSTTLNVGNVAEIEKAVAFVRETSIL